MFLYSLLSTLTTIKKQVMSVAMLCRNTLETEQLLNTKSLRSNITFLFKRKVLRFSLKVCYSYTSHIFDIEVKVQESLFRLLKSRKCEKMQSPGIELYDSIQLNLFPRSFHFQKQLEIHDNPVLYSAIKHAERLS